MSVLVIKENGDTEAAMREILSAFRDRIDLSRGVFLKPNIVFPVKDKTGEITRRKVVRAVVEVLREWDPRVDMVIGEGTAAGTVPEENFRVSGYSKLANELGLPLVDLDQVDRVELPWKYGKLSLPRLALERTYINLPILKRSSAAGISGAMKNQKGLLLPDMKKRFHKLGLHGPIAELNRVIGPALTILDGSRYLSPRVHVAGEETSAVDGSVVRWLGIGRPEYLNPPGKPEMERRPIEHTGSFPEGVAAWFPNGDRPFRRFLRLRVWSNPRACSMCRFVFKSTGMVSFPSSAWALAARAKLLGHAIRGAEVVLGSSPVSPGNGKRLICVGDCTRGFAAKGVWRHVPGCPPTLEDLGRYL